MGHERNQGWGQSGNLTRHPDNMDFVSADSRKPMTSFSVEEHEWIGPFERFFQRLREEQLPGMRVPAGSSPESV
jgi:hypothetical protein